MRKHKFDVFISHSSKDKPFALNLYYNIIANGKFPWFDASELEVSDKLFEALSQGLENSAGYLLLASKFSLEESAGVQYELACVKKRLDIDPNFKVWILRLDKKVELPDWLAEFLYVDFDEKFPEGSLLKLVEAVTGQSWILDLTRSVFLSNQNLFESADINSVWDLIVRQQTIRLSQMKSLLLNPGQTFDEVVDTVKRVSEISVFRQLPVWQPFWTQLDVGVYETSFPVRMRIAPRVTLDGLPDKYSWRFMEHSPVHCVIEIIQKNSGMRVRHVVPFLPITEFDAEL